MEVKQEGEKRWKKMQKGKMIGGEGEERGERAEAIRKEVRRGKRRSGVKWTHNASLNAFTSSLEGL